MSKFPEKCTRCGAPISWEEGASVVKCEFCGYKNNLKDDFLSLFKNYLKLRDPKKIIRNPFSLILFLPVIFLFLILNSPIKKQEKIKAEYWPTDWSKLKQVKVKNKKSSNFGKKFPKDWDKSYKELKTVRFKKDLNEACEYTKSLTKEYESYRLQIEKILYDFNIFVGYTPQFGENIPLEIYAGSRSIEISGFKSEYFNQKTYSYDKQKTINNLKRISKFLKENNNTYLDYFDYYDKKYDSVYRNRVSEISQLTDNTFDKLGSSYFEVMRQAGDKNWKLANRWSILSSVGIGDLRKFYREKYKNSKKDKDSSWNENDFNEWLLKKGILKESDFTVYKTDLKTLKVFKYSAISLRSKARNICNMPTINF